MAIGSMLPMIPANRHGHAKEMGLGSMDIYGRDALIRSKGI